jgi:nicotinamide-nucleotide amidase
MRAEIIAIGDELTTGQRLDTNSQWLAERLTECGVEVAFHTTIGDNLIDNVAAFQTAVERADFVVATGGLGPTADDLTRDALARTAGVALIQDAASLEHIRGLFASRGRQMPERNAVQADFPVGAQPIPNQYGTAPGIRMQLARTDGKPCFIFALPGVPTEMKPMWLESVAPAITGAQPTAQLIRHHRIKCFGVGESDLEAMLPDLIRRGREPSVGITVSDATITLRITATCPTDVACREAMQPIIEVIRQCLGTLIFGEEDEELEHAVVRLLAEQGKTLAVVEWATGGRMAQWLTVATAPASSPFLAGFTVTSLEQMGRDLTVDAEELAALQSVAPHELVVATIAAEAMRRLTGADIGLAVAAFPPIVDGPDARVHAAIAMAERTRRLRFPCAAHPAIRQPRAAKQALNALRLTLLGQRVPGEA